jgi:hypothetical protein
MPSGRTAATPVTAPGARHDHEVRALRVFVVPALIEGLDGLTGFVVDQLLAEAIAGFLIDLAKGNALAGRQCRPEPDRARNPG